MAKQSSILKFEGNIEDLNFAKTRDGYIVRKKPTVSKERILTDPNFLRTRQNMEEFKNVSQGSVILRKSLVSAISDVQDGKVHPRLVRVLADIKNLDTAHDRGLRTVAAGIADVAGQSILNGFDFNKNGPMDSLLLKDFSLDTGDGELVITGLKPSTELLKPLAAHKAGFNLYWTKVDFAHGESDTASATEVMVPLDDSAHTVTLTIATPPTGSGVNIFALRLVYYQTINGQDYILNDVTRTSAKIIAVV